MTMWCINMAGENRHQYRLLNILLGSQAYDKVGQKHGRGKTVIDVGS